MQKVSIFKSLDKSSKPYKTLDINEALELIKNNPQKDKIIAANSHEKYGGKGNTLKPYTDKVWDFRKKELVDEQRNMYDHVKRTMLQAVAWNGSFDGKRRKANISKVSGYIYCDVDTFDTLINEDKYNVNNIAEAKEYVFKTLTNKGFKFIKAVWRSMSGNGFGFLVKVDGLTVDNFKSTWKALRHFFKSSGIVFDTQTKDITRINVLSYDPDIFIRKDEDIVPYVAVEEEQRKTKEFRNVPLPKGLAADIMQYRLDYLYNDDDYWSNTPYRRVTYGFYFDFFYYLNHRDIPFKRGLGFLNSKCDEYTALFKYRSFDDVSYIAENLYNLYKEQRGCIQVYIPEDLPPEKQYDVENINSEYNGDVELKVKYILHNLKSKDYGLNKLVATIAIIIKEAGVAKKELITHLSENLILETEHYNTIDAIYGNTKYLYGAKKTYSNETIQLKKKKFEEYCEENHKKITERSSYDGNISQKLDEIHNSAKGLLKSNDSHDLFSFVGTYFKEAKSWAITQGEALDFIRNNYEISSENNVSKRDKSKIKLYRNINRYAEFLSREIYNYQSWKFGLHVTQCLSPESVKSRYNVVKEIKLKKGEYLSDLDLDLDDDTIIWADTGAGKTTYICEKRKGHRLILVPTIALLRGVNLKYNTSVFFNEKKNVQEGDELIVCTYSSFPNLLKIMQGWENVKISDYEMHYDEYHNMAVSSSKDFRGYELNFISDNEHLFKLCLKYTGTLFPNLHPTHKRCKIYRIVREVTAPKNFKRILYNDLMYSIERKLDANNKNIIYLQNKKEEGKLGELLDYLQLKGWNKNDIWCINADEKNSPEFKSILSNERVDDNVKIVICTSVIVEGVNIKNDDFTTVHFMSHEGLINMQQMVTRLRNVFTEVEDNDCMIYIYKKHKNRPEDESDQVDTVKIQEELVKLAQEGLKFFSKSYSAGDSNVQKYVMRLFTQSIFGKSGLYRSKDGEWDVDFHSIANISYREEKNYAYRDIDFMQMMLKEYNWVFHGDETILGTVEDNEKSLLSDAKQVRKDELREDCIEILENIREDGEKKTIELLDDDNIKVLESTNRPSKEIGLRSKVKFLCNNMEFVDACNLIEEWIYENNMSDTIWKKIVRQINVMIAKKLNVFDAKYDVTTEFAESLYEYYKKKLDKEESTGEKQLVSKTNLFRVVSNRIEKCEILKDVELDENIALEIIEHYFDVKKYLINNKVKYHLSGIKIFNDISTFSKKLDEWAKEAHENETQYTSNELADILNDIRSEMPILKMYKLDSNKAMRLIHDYYDFARVGEKVIGRKRYNTYKIAALYPLELRNVKIKPLRKIDLMDKHYDDMTYNERQIFNHQMKMNSLAYHIGVSSKVKVPF